MCHCRDTEGKLPTPRNLCVCFLKSNVVIKQFYSFHFCLVVFFIPLVSLRAQNMIVLYKHININLLCLFSDDGVNAGLNIEKLLEKENIHEPVFEVSYFRLLFSEDTI